MTLAEVARTAGVSERTVRRDIAAGVLLSCLKNGRRFVSSRAVLEYRGTRRISSTPAISARALADLAGVSLRTVRARIADGRIPVVNVSARRVRIPLTLELARRWLPAYNVVFHVAPAGTSATKALLRPVAPRSPIAMPRRSEMASVRAFAVRVGRTARQIHHDIEKGVLDGYAYQFSARSRILIDPAAVGIYRD